MHHHDVIVVGGSFSGLSAALQLARARFRVLVIDGGSPRNRFASASHGFLGSDGENPAAILERARRQLAAYEGTSVASGLARWARKGDDGFVVETGDGTFGAQTLVLATGVTDVLPDVPGLGAHWGESVIHCPFCHGYEFGGRPLGVLATGPMSLTQARMIPRWGPTTLFLDGKIEVSDDDRADLIARGIQLEETPVAAVEGEGAGLDGVRLTDGRLVPVAGLYIAPEMRPASGLAADLGCAFEETPLGPIVKTGADKATSVPGVYAVGDMARMPHSVAFAVADGAFAAMGIVHAAMHP
ncbi:NAD(P)/FAD-dependent oxidoreductase [Amorphus orientalis]|uniref:Thioredoxin reductase n=1 Tax=Amorphus orientalis TaxID=649198 RepID=A0AAE3VRM0_9HYPH|nr:NAD(P)/FAD-dependent oxidoreductase [Amorphus orientalis]MDQ0316570.1 thioredoxin reductase [Amorphus orientalis]